MRTWRQLVRLHADNCRRMSGRQNERYIEVYKHVLQICEQLRAEEDRTASSTTDKALQRAVGRSHDREPRVHDSDREGQSEMLRQFVTLLRPWGNPQAFHQAPKPIVKDLLLQERMLEERITGTAPRSGWDLIFYAVLIPFVAVSCGAAVLYFTFALGDLTPSIIENATYSVASRLRQLSTVDRVIGFVLFSWTIGTLILWTAMQR